MDDWKKLFSRYNRSDKYELIAIVILCIWPLHAQAGQNPTMKGGMCHEVPPIVGELLSVDIFWKRQSQFSFSYSQEATETSVPSLVLHYGPTLFMEGGQNKK